MNYKNFIILKNKLNSSYSFHRSISYDSKIKAATKKFTSTQNDIILFKISLTYDDAINLYDALEDLFYCMGINCRSSRMRVSDFDENILILVLWYVQYYLIYNNIDYKKILINNQCYFNFMDIENV